MKRLIEKEILEYLNKEDGLPLIILGSRQIGKTYTINQIANQYFKNNHVYLNFMNKDEIYEKLNGKTNPKQIIEIIEFYIKRKLNDNELLIFDEIQEIPSLKTSIKLFVEQKLKYKIICLGSYLANTLINDNYSFPVGKVKIINMYAMNFVEFLMATNNEKYIPLIKSALDNVKKIKTLDHEFLLSLLYDYMLVGGMPAVVESFIKNDNMKEVYELQKDIYNQYRNDLLKYVNSKTNKTNALLIYDNIAKFLSKKNNKYKLSNVESSMKYLNSQNAIKNLLITKIIYKIDNLKNICIPLFNKNKENEFKIYYNDCGFASMNLLLNKSILLEKSNSYANEKGSLCENYVFSQLKMKTEYIYYYSFRGNENIVSKKIIRNKSNTEYEIDCFIEDVNANAIAIEIKFGTKYAKSSINKVMKENNLKYGIVFSSKNFSYDEQTRIYNIPLYAVAFLEFESDRLKFK